MKVKGKVFVVTGAAGGIGSEVVREILSRGGKVFAIDINSEELAKLEKNMKDLSQNIRTRKVDITSLGEVEKLPSVVVEELGEPDGLLNIAGIIQPFLKVSEIDLNTVERIMKVNFYGTLFMIKAFLPHLLSRPEAHIVNVSSMGGFLPVPGQAIYGASKAAVKLLSEALYAELKNTPVKVTVVFPGATETDIAKHSGINIESSQESNFPMLKPREVARLIVEGMERNAFQVFTGKDSKTMNLLYRLNPRFAVDFITRQMASLLEQGKT